MIIVNPILRSILKVLSVLLYAATLLAAFGGKVDPNLSTIPATLTLVLPWLTLATIIVAFVWLIRRRFITGGLGVLTLLVGWSSIGAAFPLSAPNEAPEGAVTFKLLTFNSLHLADIDQPESDTNRAMEFLLHSGADIICLQELWRWDDAGEIPNLDRNLRDSLFKEYPHRAGDAKSDLKVLSKFPLKRLPGFVSWAPGDARRFEACRMNVKGHALTLVNMHLYSYRLSEKERNVLTDIKSASSAKSSYREFRSSIFSKLSSSFRNRAQNVEQLAEATRLVDGPMIVCGDFNDVPASWAWRQMQKAGFKDAYAQTSFGPTYTYNQHLFLFHLDQIFYRSDDLQPLWVRRQRLKTSDHYPMMAEFAFLPRQGKGKP